MTIGQNRKEIIPGKILFFMPVMPKSSTFTFLPLVHELVERGHQVTVVNAFGTKKEHPNLTVIKPKSVDLQAKMKEQTNGEGFDVIIENLANVNLERDLTMIKKNARIMVVGSRGPITINPRHLMAPEASIKGVALGSTTDEQYEQIGTAISNGIISGWVNPVIDKEYSMEEIPNAHYDIINSKGAKGNLVLKIS